MLHERQYSESDVLRLATHQNVDFRFPIHLHKSFELVFVRGGELTVTVGAQDYRVEKGHAVLIFPGQPHAYFTEASSLCTIEIFSPEYLSDLYSAYRGGKRHHPVFPFDAEGFPEALVENREDRYMIRSLLYRVASAYAKGEVMPEPNQRDEHLTYQIVSYMDDHFTEELTLHHFATHFGYHYRYMSGLIHDIYGTSFPQALHFKRIALARELLSQHRGSISEIAEACGYLSVRSFNRNFREIVGCSPREYMARDESE